MLIDSHCHLDAPEFAADRLAVVQRALAAGVNGAIVPGWRLDQLLRIGELLTWCPAAFHLRYAAGIHPLYVQELSPAALEQLEPMLCNAVAVGEIGLDRFGCKAQEPEHWRRQQLFFREQLAMARRAQLPVLIHVRRCYPELIRVLQQQPLQRGGIVHAFNGSERDACALLEAGFVLGIGSLITQPSAQRLQQLLRRLPEHAWVLETDAPDMLPHSLWCQGVRRNEPAQLAVIVRAVSRCLALSESDVQQCHTRTLGRILQL